MVCGFACIGVLLFPYSSSTLSSAISVEVELGSRPQIVYPHGEQALVLFTFPPKLVIRMRRKSTTYSNLCLSRREIIEIVSHRNVTLLVFLMPKSTL